MEIVEKKVSDLIPYENNPRIISEESVNAVAASFEAFGILQPLVIDTHNVVIAGHTRLLAAKQLGLETVPCKIADELSDDEANAYRIADNSTSELSAWDYAKREVELQKLDAFDMVSFGVITAQETDEQSENNTEDTENKGSLRSRYLVPPFSVIQGNKPDWLARKRKWIEFGIRSEIGRGGQLCFNSKQNPDDNFGGGERKAKPSNPTAD